MNPAMRRKSIPMGALAGFLILYLSVRWHLGKHAIQLGVFLILASVLYGALWFGRIKRF
jgi:hypothetical protein